MLTQVKTMNSHYMAPRGQNPLWQEGHNPPTLSGPHPIRLAGYHDELHFEEHGKDELGRNRYEKAVCIKAYI